MECVRKKENLRIKLDVEYLTSAKPHISTEAGDFGYLFAKLSFEKLCLDIAHRSNCLRLLCPAHKVFVARLQLKVSSNIRSGPVAAAWKYSAVHLSPRKVSNAYP